MDWNEKMTCANPLRYRIQNEHPVFLKPVRSVKLRLRQKSINFIFVEIVYFSMAICTEFAEKYKKHKKTFLIKCAALKTLVLHFLKLKDEILLAHFCTRGY